MNIKRILSLLLMFIIVFSLVACSDYDTTSNTDSCSNTTTITESGSGEITYKNIIESTESTEKIESILTDSSSKISKPSDSSKPNESGTPVTSTTTSTTKPTDTNVTGNNTYKQATDSDNNVTVANDGTVNINTIFGFLKLMQMQVITT